MQLNKSPGEDGLPIEFYRTFWNEIKTYLFNSYKFSLEFGSLSITQKRGVISLLPKVLLVIDNLMFKLFYYNGAFSYSGYLRQ